MDRFVLTAAQWAKMEPLCLGKPGDPGRRGKDNRLFIEAVLWIARTGSPRRDLPPSLGHWNSVFTRFRDWVKADIWKRLFDAVSDDPDMEYAWSMPPSSRSIVTDRAQKGDSKPGHRPFEGRHDHQNPGLY
jgi:transposase